VLKVKLDQELPDPDAVIVSGLLGDAISASENGRLKALPKWESGQLINMFSKQSRQKNKKMDWYGEHAGKWLYATAMAARRTGDDGLKNLLLKTADYLTSTQDDDDYLGSYSPVQHFTSNQPKSYRYSWDVRNHSYMVLGLLKVNQYFPNEKYLLAAKKIG